MKRQVGQILFVASKKQMAVYPIQVIEEITKRTLEGSETTYMVRFSTNSAGNKDMLISEIADEIFDSSQAAKDTLLSRAASSITKLVDAAVDAAQRLYPSGFEAPQIDDEVFTTKEKPTAQQVQQQRKKKLVENMPEDATVMTLPDGTVARVRSITGG